MSLLNKASLIQIPSGYKDGTLYSAKPTNGDGDFTFSRGSNLAATRVNSEGLIEKGRENLALSSNDISTQSTYWTSNQGGTTIQNSAVAPDGTTTASTITANGTNTYSGVSQSGIVMGALRYTYSVYLKAQSGTPVIRLTSYDGVTFHQQDFSITTEWERYSITFSPTAGTHAIYITSQQGVSWDAWGAQFELGLVSTDLITTTTTTEQAGILEDMPRLDYSGGATCPSLILEPQRVNHLTQSEYYSGSTWIKQSGTTVTQNTTDTLSPEGKYNASKVTSNGSNGLFHTLVYSGGGANTKSIYLKGVSGGEVVYLKDPYQTVSTTTCTLTTEWQRFTLSETQTSSASLWIDDIPSGGIYMWGAMLESSASYVSSYIPTYGSSVTRSADSCVKTGISSLIGQTEGVLFVEASTLENGANNRITISDNTINNRVSIEWDIDADTIKGFIGVGGNVETTSHDQTNQNKIALLYTTSVAKLFINGSLISTDSTSIPTMSGMNRIDFSNYGGSVPFFGNAKQVIYFPTALTDDECIALTTI